MKIGIYLGRHASRYAGVAIYSKSLALYVAVHCSKDEGNNDQIILYGDRNILDSELIQLLGERDLSYSIVESNWLGHCKKPVGISSNTGHKDITFCFLPEIKNHKFSILLDMVLLPLLAARERLNILHSTCNYGFVMSSCAQVVTVHDLFQVFPKYALAAQQMKNGISWITSRLFFKLLFFAQFKRIGHFITDNDEVATEILKRYRVAPEKITSISLGLDAVFVSYLQENDASERQLKAKQWCEKHNILPNFVLLFGSMDVRKNFERQLIAYRELTLKARIPGLLIVGNDIRIRKIALEVFSGQENLKKQGVRFIGNVERFEMPMMLEASSVVLNATLAEGFGLPAYEALAMCVRIVTGPLESLSGVVSPHCFLCQPTEQNSINLALVLAFQDFDANREMENGRSTGFKYKTMAEVADETCGLYKKINDNR